MCAMTLLEYFTFGIFGAAPTTGRGALDADDDVVVMLFSILFYIYYTKK